MPIPAVLSLGLVACVLYVLRLTSVLPVSGLWDEDNVRIPCLWNQLICPSGYPECVMGYSILYPLGHCDMTFSTFLPFWSSRCLFVQFVYNPVIRINLSPGLVWSWIYRKYVTLRVQR